MGLINGIPRDDDFGDRTGNGDPMILMTLMMKFQMTKTKIPTIPITETETPTTPNMEFKIIWQT
jgi:hypothetical protein